MTTGKNSNNTDAHNSKTSSDNKSPAGKDTKDSGSSRSGSGSNSNGNSASSKTGTSVGNNKSKDENSSTSTRGGTHEQHVEAGRQSHKNR